jgi:hypothetical protein
MLFSFIYLGEINVVSALELIIALALSLLTRMLMLILLLTKWDPSFTRCARDLRLG